MIGRRLALWLLPPVLAACSPSSGEVDLVRADGSVVRRFTHVEHAVTPEARAQGLGGHAPLGPDDAMVLDYPVVDQACITNAPVSFPIAAVFAAADGTIVGVESFGANDARTPCHDGVLTVVEVDASGASSAAAAARVVIR